MAITNTTLAAAVSANDPKITVASATGFAAGNTIRVDNEIMVQTAAATGPVVPVRRGLDGSAQLAHGINAAVATGLGTDFSNPPTGSGTVIKAGDPARVTLGGDATINPTTDLAGSTTYVLAKATAAAITLGAPTGVQDGLTLGFLSPTAAAHVVTATGLYDDGVTGGAKSAATFAAFVGANMVLQASRGHWTVVSLKGVAVA